MAANTTDTPAGLVLKDLCKSFGAINVLKNINLTVKGGDFVVFVGPSGCGKSTLLRMIAGLEDVTSGELHIGGIDVTDVDPADRGIAMVFQTYALYPHMNVAQNMGFGLRVAGVPRAEIDRKVQEAARVLQLEQYLDRRPGQLSGGQRQRVAIGRAIVRDPEVFLFDEPLSNLDAELRVGMRIEIGRLHQELGNTMIYVTHDQTEAMTLADMIVVLRAGRIEQVGSPETLYDDPDNMFVAGFIGSPKMNFLPGTMRAGTLIVEGQAITVPKLANMPEGGDLWVGIRPEHMRIAREGEASIPMRVDYFEFLGGASYLYGTVGTASCIVESHRERLHASGSRAGLALDPDRICLFDLNEQRIR
ncbi:ABC transporter ATP-binding protein [Paracoccus sp. (in: a-proteobacteria)]|uniref:ABC transporter ATP-binding protein n=1 Tax=Paracoccus sp. TaxID=267 RepID=UPI003A875420